MKKAIALAGTAAPDSNGPVANQVVARRPNATGFSCQVEIPDVKGLEPKEISVGREFILACDGPWEKDLETKNLKFDLPKESEYELKLLAFQYRNANVAEIKVTSYVAAEHKIMNLKLTNGKANIDLGAVEFFVKSVLPTPDSNSKNAQTQQPQAFSSIGPVSIQIPLQYYVVFFLILALIGSFIGFRLFLRSQRKALLRELAEHDSAQTPIAQFHQSLRKLRRENVLFVGANVDLPLKKSAILDLEASFKLYLTRKFRFPAHRWSDKQILREFKSQHANYNTEFAGDLIHILKELASIHKAGFVVHEKDVVQISKEISRLLEKIDAWKEADS